MKKAYIVFQDCYSCGVHFRWANEQLLYAEKHAIQVENKPYYCADAGDLIRKAAAVGVTMPFFTDGVKFSKSLKELFARKAKKEVKDGDSAEA